MLEKLGIAARIEEMDGASKSMQALVGGGYEVASTGYMVLLDLASQQRQLRGFVVMQRLPVLLAAIVSPRASPACARYGGSQRKEISE